MLLRSGGEVLFKEESNSYCMPAMVMVLGVSAWRSPTDLGLSHAVWFTARSYTTASKKCGVCHAVHKATASGDVLMARNVADACVYCHNHEHQWCHRCYNANGLKLHGSDLKTAHNSIGGANCTDCHTPHGAATLTRTTRTRGEDPQGCRLWTSSGFWRLSRGGCGPVVHELPQTHQQHQRTPYTRRASTSGGRRLARDEGSLGDYMPQVARDVRGSGRWTGSDTCRSCHADGLINQSRLCEDGGVRYPHFTVGQRFLTDIPVRVLPIPRRTVCAFVAT